MAKKMWAYALLNGEYVSDLKSNKKRNRLFFVWEALRLRHASEDSYYRRAMEVQPEFNFDHLTFMSTHKNTAQRKPLHPVKTGYFRYSQGEAHSAQGGDGESISHQLAILALSQLKRIPFIINNSKLTLEFTEMVIDGEDTRVQFDDGKSYYIDLIGYLDKKSPKYHEWGGKVGIEVKYTHGYESIDERIQSLERHNIAILEVPVTKSFIYPSERKKPYTSGGTSPDELEAHYNKLQEEFKKQTYAKLLSNPLQGKFARQQIKILKDTVKESIIRIKSLESELEIKAQNLAVIQHQAYNEQQNLLNMKITYEGKITSLQDLTDSQFNRANIQKKIMLISFFSLVIITMLGSIAFPHVVLNFANNYLSFIYSVNEMVNASLAKIMSFSPL